MRGFTRYLVKVGRIMLAQPLSVLFVLAFTGMTRGDVVIYNDFERTSRITLSNEYILVRLNSDDPSDVSFFMSQYPEFDQEYIASRLTPNSFRFRVRELLLTDGR